MTLQELLELAVNNAADRAVLRGLLVAAAQLSQALSGIRLAEPPSDPIEWPRWLQAYSEAATAANAPSYSQWIGWEGFTPQEPPLPWAALIAGYIRQREPGIAAALRRASAAYAALARDGSAALRDVVNDRELRRWASERLRREQGTGRGSGLAERPLQPAQSSGVLPLVLLGGVALASNRDLAGLLAPFAIGAAVLYGGARLTGPTARRSSPSGSTPTARAVARRNTGRALGQARWVRERIQTLSQLLSAAGVATRDLRRVAIAIVAHWGLECGLGSSEDNYNAGNIGFYPRANDRMPTYFVRGGRRWRAYPSARAAAADYLAIVQGSRYSPAWQALLDGASPGNYAAELVSRGYTEPTSEAERIGREVDSVARTVERFIS